LAASIASRESCVCGAEGLVGGADVSPPVLTIAAALVRRRTGCVALCEGTDPAMAFVPNNLAVLSYAAGFTLWTYATVEDSVGAVLGEGYFDDARTYVRADDLILLNAADGARILRVVANDGARVSVASIAGDVPIAPPEVPGEAILDEAGNPILDEAGAPILQG
jgi:hypothetical protein